MNKDITKIVAAILAAHILAADKVGPGEGMVLRHGSDREKAAVRRHQRSRIANGVWSSAEVAELLCEFLDTPLENRPEVFKSFVGEPEPASE